MTPRFIFVRVSNADDKPDLTYSGLLQKIDAKHYPPPTTIVFDRLMYNGKATWCPVWRLTPDTSIEVADSLQEHLSTDLGVPSPPFFYPHCDGFVAWPSWNHLHCPNLAELGGDTIRVYSAEDLGISLEDDLDPEVWT